MHSKFGSTHKLRIIYIFLKYYKYNTNGKIKTITLNLKFLKYKSISKNSNVQGVLENLHLQQEI